MGDTASESSINSQSEGYASVGEVRVGSGKFIDNLKWFGNKIFSGAEYVGESVASMLGLDESRFQYVIDSMEQEDWEIAIDTQNRRLVEERQMVSTEEGGECGPIEIEHITMDMLIREGVIPEHLVEEMRREQDELRLAGQDATYQTIIRDEETGDIIGPPTFIQHNISREQQQQRLSDSGEVELQQQQARDLLSHYNISKTSYTTSHAAYEGDDGIQEQVVELVRSNSMSKLSSVGGDDLGSVSTCGSKHKRKNNAKVTKMSSGGSGGNNSNGSPSQIIYMDSKTNSNNCSSICHEGVDVHIVQRPSDYAVEEEEEGYDGDLAPSMDDGHHGEDHSLGGTTVTATTATSGSHYHVHPSRHTSKTIRDDSSTSTGSSGGVQITGLSAASLKLHNIKQQREQQQ